MQVTILLDYQNNYVGRASIINNAVKKVLIF